MRHIIGVENLMVESDYPHGDSSWPNTQLVLQDQLRGIPSEEVADITWRNAASVFNFAIDAIPANA